MVSAPGGWGGLLCTSPMPGRQVGIGTAQQSRDTENDPDQSCVESCGVISVTAFVLLQLFETLSLYFMGKMGKFRLMLSQRCLQPSLGPCRAESVLPTKSHLL